MAEFEERTEQPTPRKRQKAREKGRVARSRDLLSITSAAGVFIVMFFYGRTFVRGFYHLSGSLLAMRYGTHPMEVLRDASAEVMLLLLPFWLIATALVLLAGFIQGGVVLKPLSIEMERLNPVNGLRRLFSLQGFFELLKALLKFLLGGVALYLIVWYVLKVIPATPAMELEVIRGLAMILIKKSIIAMLGLFLLIALFDYIQERYRFERSIRMTRQEIKEEFKETEGDPLVRARIRSIQKELARRRMIQEVQKATVVVTNPTHIAVALLYRREELPAPKVVAKGAGYVAEKIKEVARGHSVPIVEDPPLARALYRLKIGAYIPEELYKAVAKILAYIYKTRGKL